MRPLAFIPSLWIVLIYRPSFYRLDTKAKPALKTRTLSNLKDELISEVEKTVLKSVSPMRPPPFSINALVSNFRFSFFFSFFFSLHAITYVSLTIKIGSFFYTDYHFFWKLFRYSYFNFY